MNKFPFIYFTLINKIEKRQLKYNKFCKYI